MARVDEVKLEEFSIPELEELSERVAKEITKKLLPKRALLVG